jgi:hypothetical protein
MSHHRSCVTNIETRNVLYAIQKASPRTAAQRAAPDFCPSGLLDVFFFFLSFWFSEFSTDFFNFGFVTKFPVFKHFS